MGRGLTQLFRLDTAVGSVPAQPHDRHLLKLFELPIQKTVDGHLFKVVAEHPANILGHPVVGDDIDHQPAPGQRGNALQQKPLLVPAPPALF